MIGRQPAHHWQLWTHKQILQEVKGLAPRLASWEKNTHPDQIRLRAYLEDLMSRLKPLPPAPMRLFLHLDVDVGERKHLLHRHDLENYLTPLFGQRGLDPSRFVLVSATKKVGQESQLLLGRARPWDDADKMSGWQHFACSSGCGADSRRWKGKLRDELAHMSPQPLPVGPVEAHLAWHCSALRNWVNLWKPTGDAMGPVLGEQSREGFHPYDDRIVCLGLHLNLDPTVGYDLDVGMWWRSKADTPKGL
jgi:hypothetical protein